MSSKIIIVNENDNIITSKEIENLEAGDIYRVSALWLTNKKREILLARRALSKTHSPGKWGPAVGGTVEEEETYDSNITKETEEELGLKNIKFEKGPKIKISGKHNYFCQWYLSKINKTAKEFKIQKSEVAEVKWFSREELRRKIKTNPEEFIASINQWIGLFL